MRSFKKPIILISALAIGFTLGACKKAEPPPAPPPVVELPAPAPAPVEVAPSIAVATVDLGKAIDANKAITEMTSSFANTDTIYASVATTGAVEGSTRLAAKWTYQTGDLVKDDSVDLILTGPTNTSFSIANPKGWPVGNYKIEISLNGVIVQSKDFEVK